MESDDKAKPRCKLVGPLRFKFDAQTHGCQFCEIAEVCAAGEFAELHQAVLDEYAARKAEEPKLHVEQKPTFIARLTSDDSQVKGEAQMVIGFDKPLSEMSVEELEEKLVHLRSERRARTITKRESKKKKRREVDELEVMMRQLPKEGQKELLELLQKQKEEG